MNDQELKSFLQRGHSVDFFIHYLMQHLWKMCLQGSCLISSSSLNPSMHIAQFFELFFMIRVFILLFLCMGSGLLIKQGSIATSDIYALH